MKELRCLKIRWIIFLVLTLLWMGVIFSFSARNASDSTKQSLFFGRMIGHIFVSDFDEWSEEDQLAFAERYDHPVRKAAHMTEYAILGALMVGTLLYTRTRTYKRTAGLSLAACALYAASDEVHQLFIPGRSCQITDIGFDSAGALVGILIMTVILACSNSRILAKMSDEGKTHSS